jgi:hypothetical protein
MTAQLAPRTSPSGFDEERRAVLGPVVLAGRIRFVLPDTLFVLVETAHFALGGVEAVLFPKWCSAVLSR